ncbi:hypothetical protein ACR788_23715 [Sphingobacterium siyangense]|uniref:hypothetical protein n=1 Tax=Sphingobacterium siyangense TaxID=459529 RepID=UPI003DA32A99
MKAILFFGAMVLLSLAISCTSKGMKVEDDVNERIKIRETRGINGHVYQIIEVDSVEYLFLLDGAVVRLSHISK